MMSSAKHLMAGAICVFLAPVAGPAQSIDPYSRPLRTERERSVDMLHYRVALAIDLEARSYGGTATVTFRALRDGLDGFDLDAETFVVGSVAGRDGRSVAFRQDSGTVRITFSAPMRFGDTSSVTIAYEARDVDVDEERYGMSKGYDLGLGFKPATARRGPIANTLSFPTGARHWFPCYDHPNDKATTEVLATVAEPYVAVSNGRLMGVSRDPAARTRTFHWLQAQPHSTYLTVLVAGEYSFIPDSLASLPVGYWVYPSDAVHARRTFGRTPEIIAFFEQEFGVPFPWDRYDQIIIPGISGGAESTTATIIGEPAVIDERAEPDFPSEWLVAHEAAHQWWGDYVTMRDWGHTWINESFATYYEYVWSSRSYGADEGRWNMENKRRQYLQEARTKYRRPMVFHRWQFPNENFDAHTYPRGAAVIHMLRDQVGDGPFRSAITHFLRRHAYGPADTHDFLDALREAGGQNLDWFFDQWLFSPGHPELDVSWTYGPDDRAVAIVVRQVQDTALGVPVYRLPIEVLIGSGSRKQTVRLDLAQREQSFVVPVSERPQFVLVDPANRLLAEVRQQHDVAAELAILTSDDPVTRRKSIERLTRSVDDPAVDRALRARGRTDTFWRVRAEAVRALERSTRPGADAYLLERCDDPSSGVRSAAVQTIGRRGTRTSIEQLKLRFPSEKSYLVQRDIVRAVAQAEPADTGFLEKAAGMLSHRDMVRAAAVEALDRLGRR